MKTTRVNPRFVPDILKRAVQDTQLLEKLNQATASDSHMEGVFHNLAGAFPELALRSGLVGLQIKPSVIEASLNAVQEAGYSKNELAVLMFVAGSMHQHRVQAIQHAWRQLVASDKSSEDPRPYGC